MKKITIFLFAAILTGCASTIENAGIPFVSNAYIQKREAREKNEEQKKQNEERSTAKIHMEKYREKECNNLLEQIKTIKPHSDGYYYLSEYKDFLNTVNDCYVSGLSQTKYCDVNMSENPCVVSLSSKMQEFSAINEKLKVKNPPPPEEVVKYCSSYFYGVLMYNWKIEKDCLYRTQDNAFRYLAFSQATDGILFVVKDYNNVVTGPFFVYTKGKYKSGDDIGGYLKYKGEYSYAGIDGFPKTVMAFERYNQTCTVGEKEGEIKQICSKMQKS